MDQNVSAVIAELGRQASEWAIAKGFRNRCEVCDENGMADSEGILLKCDVCNGTRIANDRNFAEQLMLVVSECAEMLEGYRKRTGDEPDKHCPEFKNFEIEAADVIIRVAEMATAYGWRLGAAIEAKMAHNWTKEPNYARC